MTQLSHAFATANPALDVGWSNATADDLDAMYHERTSECRAHLFISARLWRLKDAPDILERGGIRRVVRQKPWKMSPGLVSMRLTVAEHIIVPVTLAVATREFRVEGRVAYYAACHARRLVQEHGETQWRSDEAAMHAIRTFREFDRDEAEAFHKDAQTPTERWGSNPRTPVLLTSSADVAVAETVRDGVERFIGVASETITGNRNANRRDVALERLGEFLRGADDLTLEAIAVASERSVYDLAGIVRIALDLLEKGKS